MAEMAEVLSDSRLSFAGIPCCGGPEWKVDYIHRCHIPFQRFTVYVPCSEASCQSTFDKRPLGSYNAATVHSHLVAEETFLPFLTAWSGRQTFSFVLWWKKHCWAFFKIARLVRQTFSVVLRRRDIVQLFFFNFMVSLLCLCVSGASSQEKGSVLIHSLSVTLLLYSLLMLTEEMGLVHLK